MNPTIFTLVLAAALMHALWNFVARKHSGDFVVLWLGLLVGGLLLLPLGVGIVWSQKYFHFITGTAFLFLTASVLVHAVYFPLLARAYSVGDISLVYPIARGTGIGLTAIFAFWLLGENIGLQGTLGIVIILLGVLILGLPAIRKADAGKGFWLAFMVGVCVMAYSLIDKMGVEYMDPVLYIALLFLFSALLWMPNLIYAHGKTILHKWQQHWPYVLVIGLGSIFAYLLILFAFQMGTVSYIVALRESSIIIAALLGFTFLRERFTLFKLVAILIILFGIVYMRFI